MAVQKPSHSALQVKKGVALLYVRAEKLRACNYAKWRPIFTIPVLLRNFVTKSLLIIKRSQHAFEMLLHHAI